MIYMITGQPGHGKTLRAMHLALEFQAKGRPVYVHGVRGLKHAESGFIELEDPKKWQDLPDGSVVVLDECYGVFPRRSSGGKVPDYVDAMARHRHRGFDFILICQQAKQQIDIFLLGLVERHEHVRRKMGFKAAIILWWDKFSDNVKASNTKFLWKYPKALMARNMYESTTQDTTQKKVPWYIWALPIVALMLGLLIWKAQAFFHPAPAKHSDSHAASLPASASPFSGSSGQQRPDDLIKFLKPRIEGQPWTAPAYDNLPIVSHPRVFCMAMEDGRCGCVTEQGTRYAMRPKLCRTVARDGLYNPTIAPDPANQSQYQQQQQQRPDQQVAPAPGQAVDMTGQPVADLPHAMLPGAAAGWPSTTIPQTYAPPQQTHPDYSVTAISSRND